VTTARRFSGRVLTIWSSRMAEEKASPLQMSLLFVRSGPDKVEVCAACTRSTRVGSIMAYESPKADSNSDCSCSRSSKPFSNILS
jgi:hypothetical protein